MSDQEDNQIENPVDNQVNNPVEAQEDKTWGMLCHLAALAVFVFPLFGNIIGPLIVWLVKKDQSAFVDDQGKESLNFQITMSIAMVIASILILAIIGAILAPAILLYTMVMAIIAGVAANNGTAYRYQYTYRFIK